MIGFWTVTDEDGDYEYAYPSRCPSGGKEWAMDAEHAAEQWAEWVCQQEAEYPEERIAIVTSPEGEVSRWVVTMEPVPTFHASREVTR